MQILLANAKIMHSHTEAKPQGVPKFQDIANRIASEMAMMDVDTMAQLLGCNRKIAFENYERYRSWDIAEKMPAIMSYNGQAYKHLKAHTLSNEALEFANGHLWITCFLYGLLRPMDAIVPYRMEHTVALATTDDQPLNQFWRSILTDALISSVKADDGILIHLSTEEYEHLFDWKRVLREVTVVQPLFYVRNNAGQLKMQAVWAKACRGAMVRYICENKITNPDLLTTFAYEGFEFTPTLLDDRLLKDPTRNALLFTRQ